MVCFILWIYHQILATRPHSHLPLKNARFYCLQRLAFSHALSLSYAPEHLGECITHHSVSFLSKHLFLIWMMPPISIISYWNPNILLKDVSWSRLNKPRPPHKNVHVTLETCSYVTLQDKRDFADGINSKILRWGDVPGLPMGARRGEQEGQCDVMTELQTELMQPGGRGHQEPLKAVEGKRQILLWSLQQRPALLMLRF